MRKENDLQTARYSSYSYHSALVDSLPALILHLACELGRCSALRYIARSKPNVKTPTETHEARKAHIQVRSPENANERMRVPAGGLRKELGS
jgi:hypothetical protein